VNAVVYALLFGYEVKQTLHHVIQATSAVACEEPDPLETEKCA
jgi:hypothetical protein